MEDTLQGMPCRSMLLVRPSHVPYASSSPLGQHSMSLSRTSQQFPLASSSAVQQAPVLSRLPVQLSGTWQYVPCSRRSRQLDATFREQTGLPSLAISVKGAKSRATHLSEMYCLVLDFPSIVSLITGSQQELDILCCIAF